MYLRFFASTPINKTLFINIGVLLCLGLALAQPTFAQTVFAENSWGRFADGAKAVCTDGNIDNDNDGLIELCYLEDVDAIRHVLDGSGYQASSGTTTITSGCGGGVSNDTCFGYELVRDLDFNDDDSYVSTANKVTWTQGTGWPYIAGTFSGILEGNGHTISNLYVNAPTGSSPAGRFIQNISGHIRNLGLRDATITITGGNQHGAILAYQLQASASITNCYISGRLNNTISDDSTRFSALVQNNIGEISNSYIDMEFIGQVYGLFVGENGAAGQTATISNSYIIGNATSATSVISNRNTDFFGFMVINRGLMEHSYYAVETSPNNGYPLTANNAAGIVSNSFYDNSKWGGNLGPVASGRGVNHGSVSRSVWQRHDTGRLQNHRGQNRFRSGIYYQWNTDDWDFGTNSEYPAVKYVSSDDTSNPACRNEQSPSGSQQPMCDTLLREQRNNQPSIAYPTAGTQIAVAAGAVNSIKTINVGVADDDVYDKLTLSLFAMDENQTLVNLTTANVEVLPNGNPEREQQVLKIRVPMAGAAGSMTELSLVVEDNSGFANARSEPVSLRVAVAEVDSNTTPTITTTQDSNITLSEGASIALDVMVDDEDNDLLSLSLISDHDTVATATIVATSGATRTLKITGLNAGSATITATVDDGRGEANSKAPITFTVTVEDNQAPTLNTLSPKNQTLPLDSMTDINVWVADNNFNTHDIVTLTARSSTPSVVSVEPERRGEITSTESRTFMLNALTVGDAKITITATDSKGEHSDATIAVHVNAPPAFESHDTPITLKAGREAAIEVVVSDTNIDDVLTITLSATDPNQNIVAIMTTSVEVMTSGDATRTTQTLIIRGLEAEATMLTIAVNDGRGATAETAVAVTVQPNTTPTIASLADIRLLEETSTTLVVRVRDVDADDPNEDLFTVSARSNNTGVAVVRVEQTGSTTYGLAVVAKEITTNVETAIITVTANDGRGITNSEVSTTFTVTVEASVAPTLTVKPATKQTLPLNSTASIVVSVSDNNFNTHDIVTLTARSSAPSVVSVGPERRGGITSAESRTFTLNALAGGDATITITAMDSQDLSSSAMLDVRVNAPPMITTYDKEVTAIVDRERNINVEVSDANIDDDLSLTLTATDSSQRVVEIVTTSTAIGADNNMDAARTPQTLTIRGLEAGMTTLGLVVSDGIVDLQSFIRITVRANAAPTIDPPFADIDVLRETTTTLIMSVDDADDDDKPANIRVEAMSSKRDVVDAVLEHTGGGTYNLFIRSGAELSTATITVTVDDRRGKTNSVYRETFEVEVTIRPAVLRQVGTQVTTIGETLSLELSDYFGAEDKAALNYRATGLPDNARFNFNNTSGTLVVTPADGDESTNTKGIIVEVTATDNNGTAMLTFTLLINAEPTGAVNIATSSSDRWQLEVTSTVMDANNGSDPPPDIRYQWYKDNTMVGTNSDSYVIADNADSRVAGTTYRVKVNYTDNIGQISEFNDVYTIANIAPTITSFDIAAEFIEGTALQIDAVAVDANYDALDFMWRAASGGIFTNASAKTTMLSFSEDFITAANTTRTQVTLTVAATDGDLSTSQTISVMVIKKDNGDATLGSISGGKNGGQNLEFPEVVGTTDPDGGIAGAVIYQWQLCLGSMDKDCAMEINWQDIGSAVGTAYTIADDLAVAGNEFRVKVAYTDGQGYDEELFSDAILYTPSRGLKIRVKVFLEGPLR